MVWTTLLHDRDVNAVASKPLGNKEQLELVNLLLHWSEKILLS